MVKFLSSLLILAVWTQEASGCCQSRPKPLPTVTTPEYPGWVYCYYHDDPGTSGCLESAAECDGVIIGYGLAEDCSNRESLGFIRCVSNEASVRTCRPYEAGCASRERQQPAESSDRASDAALKIISDTLEECESYDPYIRCVSGTSTSTSLAACKLDIFHCTEGKVQVPSELQFSTKSECQLYAASSYIRCEKEGDSDDFACFEYDSNSQYECPISGYSRVPGDLFYSRGADCMSAVTYDLYYIITGPFARFLCLRHVAQEAPENSVKIVELHTYYIDECHSYENTVKWNRWIDIASNDTQCHPKSEGDNIDVIPPGDFAISQLDVFDDKASCIDALYYIRCYDEETNELFCISDVSGCTRGSRISSDQLYTSWSTCIQPEGYRKCVNVLTGEVTCRPIPDNCEEDTEFWTGSTFTSSVEECRTSNVWYYKCYINSVQSCEADYDGCGAATRMLSNSELTKFYVNQASCDADTNFDWYRCYGDGLAVAICRPQSCELNEYAMSNTTITDPVTFSSWATCDAATVSNWYQCYGEGLGVPICRAESCMPDEYAMLQTPGVEQEYNTHTECGSASGFDWFRCYGEGMADGYCRPQSCKSSEYAMLDVPGTETVFASHSDCHNSAGFLWYKCYVDGTANGYCRPQSCMDGESPMHNAAFIDIIQFNDHTLCNDYNVTNWQNCDSNFCRPTGCLSGEASTGSYDSFGLCTLAAIT